MIIPTPNSGGHPLLEDRSEVNEVNHCHGPGRGHPCEGGDGSSDVELPDDPDRYFVRDKQTVMVPLGRVETIRARPEGITEAERRMRKAYEGEFGRRAPVTLQPQRGGGFTVLDGNSTVAIARKHGWRSIPAHLVTSPSQLADFNKAQAEKKAAKAARKAAMAAA